MSTILGFEADGITPIELVPEARARGTYIIGTTGMGKTTLLQSIAYQDMRAGHGVCVLDPHGDMVDWLLERIPPGREEDVILFNPADVKYPFGLNLLARNREDDPQETQWVVSTIMATIRRLYEWSWGPRLEHVLGHTLWTAMAIPRATLIEALLLLSDEEFRKGWAKQLNEPLLQNFWGEFPKDQRNRLEFISSTVNKLTPFLLDSSMRNIVGQTKNSFNMRRIMDDQKILLVNLSKGDLGENNSALLGSVIINLILITALSRRGVGYKERQAAPFHVLVDEYQNFASSSFSVLQSEARKYAVDLVVAHQFRDQLTEETRGSALNVGNFICFRTTGVDSQELAGQFDNTPPPPQTFFQPKMKRTQKDKTLLRPGSVYVELEGPQRLYSDVMMQKANELANLPPFRFQARIIEPKKKKKHLVLAEHSLTTIDPESPDTELVESVYGKKDEALPAQIRRQSRALARPKVEVEEEIHRRTLGRAAMILPETKQVEASEIIQGPVKESLLTSDL